VEIPQGKAPKDLAVVVPEPNSKVTSAAPAPGSTTGTGAKSTGTSTSSTAAPTAAIKAEGWGTLKGKVLFGGDPPPVKELVEKGKAAKDPEFCAKDAPIPSERLIVDPGSKGVKFTLVYLARPTAVNEDAKKAAASQKIEFDQKNCVFEPHVVAVMTGENVLVKSSDQANHNVNFQLRNLQLNRVLAPGQTMTLDVTSPERTPGPVTCNIHPWMESYWMVLDHPYFAVTDAQGNFEIKNAPAGTQKLVVWQESTGFVTPGSGEDVNIKANDTTTKEFKIDPAKVRPKS